MAIRPVILQMMHDRGFIHLCEEEDCTMKFRNDSNEYTMIYMVDEPKVSVKKIKFIMDLLNQCTITNKVYTCLIIVYKHNITTFAKQFISSDVKHLMVQLFSEKELSFNITKHKFVPKHTILSTNEKKDILRKYNTSVKHFPSILHSDPVCRYYGCMPGTMLKIERHSETCGVYTLYRVVV